MTSQTQTASYEEIEAVRVYEKPMSLPGNDPVGILSELSKRYREVSARDLADRIAQTEVLGRVLSGPEQELAEYTLQGRANTASLELSSAQEICNRPLP